MINNTGKFRFYLRHGILRCDADPVTLLQAVEKTINKWEFISRMNQEEIKGVWSFSHSSTCGLCNIFGYPGSGCLYCPVSVHTGSPECRGTPFYQFYSATKSDNYKLAIDEARKELIFLLKILVDIYAPGHTVTVDGELEPTYDGPEDVPF